MMLKIKKIKLGLIMGLVLSCFLIFINVSKVCANSQISGWDPGLTKRLAAGIHPDSVNYFELCPDGPNGKCYGEISTGKGFYTIANDELCKINSKDNFYLNEYNKNVQGPFEFNWKEDNTDVVANLKIDTTDFASPITPNIYLGLQENVPYGDVYLGIDEISNINEIDKARLKFKASYCFGSATDQIDIDSYRRARFFYHIVWYNPIKEKSYGVSINLLDFRQHLDDGSNIGADNYLLYETDEANNCVIQLGGKAWGIIPQDYQPIFDASEDCSFENQGSDSWIEVDIPISDILNKLVDEGYLSKDDLSGTVTCLIVGGAELWGRLSASMEVKNHYFTVRQIEDCNSDNTDSTGKCSVDCGASAGCDGKALNSCSANSLKKCDSNCLEISSCGDGICNCGETSENCLEDCPYNLSPAKGLGWDYNLTKRCVKTTGEPEDENYYQAITQCENEKHWLMAVESEKTFGASCPGPQNRSFLINGSNSPVKLNWESHQSEYGENWSVNMKIDMINYSHPCGAGHFTWFAFMNQDGPLPKPKELISSNIISYNDSTLPGGATRCIVSAQFFWDGKAHLIEIFVASTNWGDKDDHPGVIFFTEDILGGMDYLALEGSYFGHQLQLSEDPNWKWGDTEISIDWAPIIDFSINQGYFDAPTDWGNTSTQSVQVASEVYNKAITDLWHTDFRISSKTGYGKITSINTSNDNPKIGDTVKINYTVQNISADDTITVLCGPGYLPDQHIFSQYLQEKAYTLKNGEQKIDFCSFVVEEDLYQEQQNGKDVIGITAVFHSEPKIWDQTKYEDITILPASPVNHLPIGFLDLADQSQITGWAYDSNSNSNPINVHIYIDGKIAGSSTANQSRPDLVLAGVCPDSNHGFIFSTPTDLSEGEHTVNVYAINQPEGTNPELIGSPMTFTVSAPIQCNANRTDFTGKCSVDCGASAGCNGIAPNACSLNSLKKCDSNCQEISSCGDEVCNCGETPENCLGDCPAQCLSAGSACFTNSECCSNICNQNCCQQSCLIDDWYNIGNIYSCCDGSNKCTCQNQEYRDYYCDTNGECAYTITNTKIIKSSCHSDSNCQSNNNISDGTLIKTSNSFKIYIIINQKKKWIPTPEVFETLGYQWTDITIIDKNQLDLISDYEDNLIRALNDCKVYLIVQGIKRHIPNPEIFLNYGFEWNDIKEVNQETINQYKTSLLIKESKKEETYYLCPIRKIKRWLKSPEIFNSYNNKWEDIQVISKYEMDSYPTSNLIKLNNSNDVYLIEGNKKRLIKSVEEFEREGLDWGRVMGVSSVELNWFE